MEWVETTGKTIEEAKERALDQLGVHQEDAEFEIIEEPKQGLFGRVRGEARVRARVKPTQARQKVDRRDRKRAEKPATKGEAAEAGERRPPRAKSGAKGAGSASAQGSANGGRSRQSGRAAGRDKMTEHTHSNAPSGTVNKEQMVDARQVGEEATAFMEQLVGAFGLSGTVELVEDGDDLEVRVHGAELGLLVGPRGTTLQAVQDLARVASQRRLGDHDTRLRVDVGGYRERRKVALGKFAVQMADEVKASGVARVLEPMSSADRKIIHDTLTSMDGIETRSEGDDPYRRVVIAPANG